MVWVDEHLVEVIDIAKKRLGLSRSELFRLAILEYLKSLGLLSEHVKKEITSKVR